MPTSILHEAITDTAKIFHIMAHNLVRNELIKIITNYFTKLSGISGKESELDNGNNI